MTIRCLPDDKEITHDLSLTGIGPTGDTVTVGFKATDATGKPDIKHVRYSGYPTGTPRVNTGDGEFSNLRPPYGQFSRRDWSGGIGALNGDDDSTKYWFGKRVWSVVPQKMMLSPRLFQATIGYPARTGNFDTVQKPITWVDVPAGSRFAWYVTTSYTMSGIQVLLRTLVDNGFTLEFRSDNAGSPGTLLSSVTDNNAIIGSHRYQFAEDYTAGSYWLVIYGTAAIQVATCAATAYTVKKSTDGGQTWAASSDGAPVFMVMSDTNADDWVHFRYRWADYAVVNKKLYINGDRGACDAQNAGEYTVIDATKNWATNAWAGAIVKLNDTKLGWRRIVSNTATTLTVDKAWDSALTTDNWYVIVGADKWTEIDVSSSPFDDQVWDAEVVREEIVYFAQGPAKQIKRMKESNESGTWTRLIANEAQAGDLPGANFLVQVYDQVDGPVLYKIVNGNGFVSKAPAVTWGTDMTWGTEIKIGNDNWEDLSGGCEYDGKLAVPAMDSIWMVKNGVAEKVSIDMESQWTYYTGRRPTVKPPYLVFPFGNRAQRLYNNIVESFGPERESGVPKKYDGEIMDNLTLVGGLVIVKDGGKPGQYATDAEGGAYLERNGGWHYLAGTGMSSMMRAAWYQRTEDDMDMIWLGDRNGLHFMHVPRSWDWTEDPRYEPTNKIEHDGWFITGWYDTGKLLPQKWWSFMSVYATNLSASRKIRVYYQVSNGEEYDTENLAANWTFAEEITAGYTNHITLNTMGRRIRFLFLLMGDGDSSPVIEGYSVNYLSRDDDAESWQLTFSLGDCRYTKAGDPEEYATAEDITDVVNYWARTVRPLTMRFHFPFWDNKEVLIERPGIVPLESSPENFQRHLASMVIKGIEEPPDDPGSSSEYCPTDSPATGPFEVTLAGTVQPDQTTQLVGAIDKVIRTDQHTYKTKYTLNGTWYAKSGENWIETNNDDFYDVYAFDKNGSIVAVGVHDAVTDPNVRTGTLSALSPKRIASIGVHIHGTPFRPSGLWTQEHEIHFWFPYDYVTKDWGLTEYGAWARVQMREHGNTGAGWYYLGAFWSMISDIGFGQPGDFNGQTLLVRQLLTLGSFGASLLHEAFGQFNGTIKWEEDFEDFTGGWWTSQAHEFTVVAGTGWHDMPGATGQLQAIIYDGSNFDYRMNHYIWVHFPPVNKITLTSAGLENVCP